MKTLEDQMSFYAAYHQDGRNKLTHFFGVPAIIFAILIPLSWPGVSLAGWNITPALVIAAVVLGYYLVLDLALGLCMMVVFGALMHAAALVAALPLQVGLAWFAAFFIGGWIVQLVGHVFEGRKPALADNLFQIFVAPIFLAAEVAFMLGMRKDLESRVNARALKMRAEAGFRAPGAPGSVQTGA